MSKLTLLLAWLAPLWYIRRTHSPEVLCRATLGAFKRVAEAEPGKCGLLDFTGEWHVAFGLHHYSHSKSLRTALVLALRKLDREPRNWLKEIYGKMPELELDKPAKPQLKTPLP